jgi:TusA-related sulfurtransferase
MPESNGTSSVPISDQLPELELDARGMEPPQPLIRIIEALPNLPPSAVLKARTDRRPMHLYAELETRGFIGKTEEEADGSYITKITRK